jgi:hypothetical protein
MVCTFGSVLAAAEGGAGSDGSAKNSETSGSRDLVTLEKLPDISRFTEGLQALITELLAFVDAPEQAAVLNKMTGAQVSIMVKDFGGHFGRLPLFLCERYAGHPFWTTHDGEDETPMLKTEPEVESRARAEHQHGGPLPERAVFVDHEHSVARWVSYLRDPISKAEITPVQFMHQVVVAEAWKQFEPGMKVGTAEHFSVKIMKKIIKFLVELGLVLKLSDGAQALIKG